MSSPRADVIWQRIADHHVGPPRGGVQLQNRFFRQYAATLAALVAAFVPLPPAHI